jgi:hypothetical protein
MEFYLCHVKKLIFILILAIFLKPIFPVIEYMINYEYISTVLCENKAKPIMHCNGKCHLMKELAKANENDKSDSSDKKGNTPVVEILFFQEINAISFFSSSLDKEKMNDNYSNLYSNMNLENLFRPPIFIS